METIPGRCTVEFQEDSFHRCITLLPRNRNLLLQAILRLRWTRCTSFRGYITITHLFIKKKKKNSVISMYVHMSLMFFIIYHKCPGG